MTSSFVPPLPPPPCGPPLLPSGPLPPWEPPPPPEASRYMISASLCDAAVSSSRAVRMRSASSEPIASFVFAIASSTRCFSASGTLPPCSFSVRSVV